jgi:predicted nucleic acid-binding Zn ribbon protein
LNLSPTPLRNNGDSAEVRKPKADGQGSGSGALPPLARGGSSPIATALQQTIARMDSAGQIRQSLALAYWPRVVGPQAAEATQVETVRDGVLFVKTRSSVWSHELTLHKSRLLLGLNQMLGGNIIHEIIFRAKGVKKGQEKHVEETPSPEEMALVVLEPEEKLELRSRMERLIHVGDDHTREVLARRMMLDARVRHWRLEHGWRVCVRCSAAHHTEHTLCPICRLCR